MTRKFLLILPFVALLMYDCNKSGFKTHRFKTHPLIEGVQIFAVIPAEHVASAGGEKLLVASSSQVSKKGGKIRYAYHAVIPRPVNRCIQFDLDYWAKIKIRDARRDWGVKKWILQIPHQDPIEFSNIDNDIESDLFAIPNLKRTRVNEIRGMMFKRVQMNLYEMIAYVEWGRAIMWFLVILFVAAVCSSAIADKRQPQASDGLQAKRGDDKPDGHTD